ncbi:unnamed protein product [Ectocarpus sp. 6 AP-2014]
MFGCHHLPRGSQSFVCSLFGFDECGAGAHFGNECTSAYGEAVGCGAVWLCVVLSLAVL